MIDWMKYFLKIAVISILCLLLLCCLFFFWAQQAALSEKEYTQIHTHKKSSVKNTDSTLSLVTYNIGYLSGMNNNTSNKLDKKYFHRNLNTTIGLLNNLKADIIAFQEIDFRSNRSFKVNQHQKIAGPLFNYSATAVNWDKKYVPFPYWPIRANFKRMLSGQSIMSQYPIEDHQRIVLKKPESNPFYYNAFYIDRLAQIAKIKHPVKDFYLFNIHVEAYDKKTRKEQLEYILKLVKEKAKNYPVLLIGDFNSSTTYENAAINMFLECNILECAGKNKIDTEFTFSSDKPYERIDFIFYTKKDFQEVESSVLKQFGEISDHLPFFSRLKIK